MKVDADYITVELEKGVDPELLALEALAKKFQEAMFKRLKEKYGEGYQGWNDEEHNPVERLEESFKEHLKKGFTEKNCIDMANFLAMIWNRK